LGPDNRSCLLTLTITPETGRYWYTFQESNLVWIDRANITHQISDMKDIIEYHVGDVLSESISDRIPSREECSELMAQYSMLPNIVEHSIQVMRVSLAITDNLKSGVRVNRDMVVAAALLHDITKTRSLQTKEHHDVSGGELLRKIGFIRVAEIVEQHVFFRNLNLKGSLEEREIVYYADKRVMHDKIVTIQERVHDLVQRYGTVEEIRNKILKNMSIVPGIESKIDSFMKIDIQGAIQEISAVAPQAATRGDRRGSVHPDRKRSG